ncbi:endonuclease domain-containing protein [Novosphingobium sp.]|jgi:very-short-patch-repair endonuclease|uniref:endonuclease domain-containing protein n=1 Tax=Novosphingobium sp. TaxID=1874826 RepID=UPI002FE15441
MITGPRGTLKLARKLRSEMTLPEGLLWRELRLRPGGFKFRRQHPAGVYVLDFYCAAARLAIEVDGFAHDSGCVIQRDAARSHFLRSQRVATLRVPARIVLRDICAAVARIVEVCEGRARGRESLPVPLHHPSDGPPPPVGEE